MYLDQIKLKAFKMYLDQIKFTFTFSHFADAFIQSDLQIRTIETIKMNKRAMVCMCYNDVPVVQW